MAASSPSPVAGFEHGGIFRLKDRGRNGKSASLPKNPLHPHSSQPFPSHVGSRRLGSKRQMEKSSTSSIPSVVLEKRVTLVRHGQSNWNELGKLQGSSDFSILTSKGEAQAEITRKTLQGKHFDVGFRSPLARASRTAEVIWDSRPSQLIDLWELREIDLYSFQGLLKEEGKKKYGAVYDAWKTDPANFEIDGKFPVRELWERGAQCWETILKTEGIDVLVVAHNAINQSMVANALGLGPEYFRRLTQSNCGLTTFSFTPSNSAEPAVVLEQLNQTPAPPLMGNVDKAKNRAVLICASEFTDGVDHGEIASAIALALGDECVDFLLCDEAASSFTFARSVAAVSQLEAPKQSSGSLSEETMCALRSAGTTVMFAESQMIESILERALQVDIGLGSRIRLSCGGITIVDFIGGHNASVACLNYTAHL